jgi:pimeloyl-ACP methyl ester carboxylesterase
MTAYHEAGHAVVSVHCPASDPIHKATIIPRGRALGMVMRLPESDKISYLRDKMHADLAVSMGGRAAEEIIFGHEKVSSGASSDIQYATRLANAMVTQWAQTWLRPSLADWSMLDMLPAITCPVLALQGSDDDHGSPQQLRDIGKGVSGPVDCVMLESCGHVPHFQARERVMTEISRFLSRVR